MRHIALLSSFVLLAGGTYVGLGSGPGNATLLSQTPASAPQAAPAAPTEMTTYYLVLLRRGPAWTAAATPEVTAVSQAHRANIDRLTKAGQMVVAGPFLDQTGANALSGLFILRADSLADAKTITDSDPAVKAGRFVYELVPWMGPKTLRY